MAGFLARTAQFLGIKNSAGGAVNTSQELMNELMRGTSTKAGVSINAANAATIIAVQSAVSLLSETVAQLPLPVYKKLPEGGKARAEDHPVWPLLNVAPNSWQSAFQWKEMMQGHLMQWGRCYSMKTVSRGRILELLPLHPSRVSVKQDTLTLRLKFTVTLPDSTTVTLDQSEMFWILDRTVDGIRPISRIDLAREGLGGAKAAENFSASFFGNNGMPAGILSTEQKLTAEQIKQLQNSWKDLNGGDNSFGIGVLDGGFKFSQITTLLRDAQFIETRKFAISEVARIWRIPPHMLGDLEKATFSNIEHQGQEFVNYCLMPWLKRWEMAINTQLIAPERQSPTFAEFLVDGLLRGDIKTRYGAYSQALKDGWLNRNEVREMENRNPIPGGDEYIIAASVFGGQTAEGENDDGSDETPQPAGS